MASSRTAAEKLEGKTKFVPPAALFADRFWGALRVSGRNSRISIKIPLKCSSVVI
jgi:hypothetical protein